MLALEGAWELPMRDGNIRITIRRIGLNGTSPRKTLRKIHINVRKCQTTWHLGHFSGYPSWQCRKDLLCEGLKAQDWKVSMKKKSLEVTKTPLNRGNRSLLEVGLRNIVSIQEIPRNWPSDRCTLGKHQLHQELVDRASQSCRHAGSCGCGRGGWGDWDAADQLV